MISTETLGFARGVSKQIWCVFRQRMVLAPYVVSRATLIVSGVVIPNEAMNDGRE
jgi:hypothetical protein